MDFATVPIRSGDVCSCISTENKSHVSDLLIKKNPFNQKCTTVFSVKVDFGERKVNFLTRVFELWTSRRFQFVQGMYGRVFLLHTRVLYLVD